MTEELSNPLEEPAENNLEAEAQSTETLEALDTEVDVVTLQSELSECQAKMNEYLDGWQRARAEFANYKKRIEREQAQVYQSAAGNIIKRYLEVTDDLDRALKNRPAEGDGADWAEGIDLIYRKLLSIMESEGVTIIEAEGQAFDPNFHEAISNEEAADVPSGQIIEVIKQGYLLGDRVLRPAGVRVAK
jgi:molecular chaperone GrpE